MMTRDPQTNPSQLIFPASQCQRTCHESPKQKHAQQLKSNQLEFMERMKNIYRTHVTYRAYLDLVLYYKEWLHYHYYFFLKIFISE